MVCHDGSSGSIFFTCVEDSNLIGTTTPAVGGSVRWQAS
jgi:hypothetical protein